MASLEPAIDDEEKLLSQYDDVEWVDDVAQYKCTRCEKVLVQHFISNCAHKFCSNCKRVMDDGSHRWRCTKCKEFIQDMGQQDLKFRDRVRRLRLHCLNRKYGCDHICPVKDLKEHLRRCEHTRERALPVLYKGDITAEMVERMLSMQIVQLRKEMQEMREEVREMKNNIHVDVSEEQKGVNGCTWELGVEVDQLKQRMTEIEKKQKEEKWKLRVKLFNVNDRVDGVKSDLTVETTRLRNDIMEMQNQLVKRDSSGLENVSLAVEENKAKILKLEGKTDTWFDIMDAKDRKTNEQVYQLKNELKTKDIEVEQTMSEMKTAQGKEWAEAKDRVGQCYVEICHLNAKADIYKAEVEIVKAEIGQMTETMKKLDEKANETEVEKKLSNIKTEVETLKINNKKNKQEVIEEGKRYTDGKVKDMISPLSEKLDEKMSECNEKITKIEKTTQDNQLINNSKLEQKMFHLETFIHLRNPQQINDFTLAEDKCNFQPDFTWKISGLKEKLKQTTFEIKSAAFRWTGYPVKAQAKIELKQDNNVYMSLCLKEINEGKAFQLKLIPYVYYVLRDRSGNKDTKHMSRSFTYVFASPFNTSLTFEPPLTHKSRLTNPLYNVDDSIVVEVYVEPPSMAQLVHSYDGTLVWAIDNYRKGKQIEKEELVRHQESPYFYTAPNGYRVRVRMWLDGWGEYEGQGLTVQILFLPGEFDAHRPLTFPHRTTITLFNRKDPQRNITKTVDQDIKTNEYYFIDMCSDEEIENVIENDTLFFKVTIKSKT